MAKKNIIEASKNKQEVRKQKSAAREKLTNWYMINLAWGFVGVIVLQLILMAYSPFPTPGTILITRIMAGVFAAGGTALLILWFRGGKVRQRFLNYTIFTGICAVVLLCISFFAEIRLFFVNTGIFSIFHMFMPHRMIWAFMILIGVWLVVALVIYFVKHRKI